MKEQPFRITVSKPYTRCIGCEHGSTNLPSNLLVITQLVFWHIVIGITVQDQIKKLYSG
jgi:hypothetical protein